ncbi:hypothetical protein D9B85_14525 [Corynebacterium diphtheriae]|nr:hypothetical protein D9B85_14525 [Corynebacterium diphtheriae]
MIICNRTHARAESLAQEIAHRVDVEIIEFDQLAANLHRADVISSCTGSLHHSGFFQARKTDRHDCCRR